MARVQARRDFQRDLDRQIAYLDASDRRADMARLAVAVGEAVALLRTFPQAGRTVHQGVGVTFHLLRLRRVPFVVTYSLEGRRDSVVTLERPFHLRQRRPLR